MYVTVIAVLCSLANPLLCIEERVTDTAMDDTLSMQDCLLGPPKLAKWLSEHPSYQSYRLAGWKCQIGNREPPPPGGKA